MARKILFEVADPAATPEAAPAPTPRSPRPSPMLTPEEPARAPALSAMARSLQAAAAASIREIDTQLIEQSRFADRIADDDEDMLELAQSIRERGQLIPILVSPTSGGRFRIVYGRRRLAALRKLGLQAKALVREMDEDQAIIAQGQENSYRKDLSWIEKAMFARQLHEAGKSDELICDTLNIDQKARRQGDKLTGLSRMRQVSLRLDPELIDAVGPAPSVGRDRWYAVAQAIDKAGFPPGNQMALITEIAGLRDSGLASDARFSALEGLLRPRPEASAPRPAPQRGQSTTIGSVSANSRSATITVRQTDHAGLHHWIAANPEAALNALLKAAEGET